MKTMIVLYICLTLLLHAWNAQAAILLSLSSISSFVTSQTSLPGYHLEILSLPISKEMGLIFSF